ncbi:MAG TPA: YceI family protein [Gemmatimonadales bacterium]|nr:YceI family protein [Gemmatimonadales bacterium]
MRVAKVTLVLAGLMGLVAAGASAQAAGKTYTKVPVGSGWRVDPAHSEVGFRIRHLVGRVRGQFTDWEGIIVTKDTDWTHGTVNVTVRTKSINTGNPSRDMDLRSPRFFAVDSFPTMTFESTGLVTSTDLGNNFEMSGLLTIKGHTHPVVFKGQYRGLQRDMNGKERLAFDGTSYINRKDYGITWNQVVEAGNLLSDDVEIEISLEAVRQ